MNSSNLRLVRERLAESDLLEQVDHLRQESVSTALRFVDAVEHSLNRLVKMPEIGHICELDHSRLCNIRVWPVKDFPKYLIFYRITEAEIQILRILHGARDITAILDEDK